MGKINNVLRVQDKELMSANAESEAQAFLDQMSWMSEYERVVVFQVLTDFYCPRCGIEQPYGDCQCR